MAQLYKKTGTCSATVAQVKYPMYLVVGESAGSPSIFPSPGMVLNYPTAHSDTYVKATSKFTTYYPYCATDPSKSLTGSAENSAWRSSGTTNQRFHFDLGSAKIIRGIYYENYHFYGGGGNEGAKNFIMQGSAESSAFAELTYATDTNWTQIGGSMQFEQHVASNVADPKYIGIANNTAYRYIALKIADNWGGLNYMGLRRIVLLTDEGFVHCSGHCQDDFGDIRFHDAADAALDYMIDWPTLTGTTPNQSVGVWVAPSPGTSDTNVVMKYGDSSLTDASTSTIFISREDFEAFDDEDDLSTSKGSVTWTQIAGAAKADTAKSYAGSKSGRFTVASTCPSYTIPCTATDSIAVSWRSWVDSGVHGNQVSGGDGSNRYSFVSDYLSKLFYYYNETSTSSGVTVSQEAWHKFELKNFNWTNETYEIWLDDVKIATATGMYNSSDYENAIRFMANMSSTYNGKSCWYDEIIVRKYASPEPTWGTWGAEEAIEVTSTGLFDGKVLIKSSTSKQFDGKTVVQSAKSDLFDAETIVQHGPPQLFDGTCAVQRSTAGLFDGTARIKASGINSFDTEAYVFAQGSSVFNGFTIVQNEDTIVFDGFAVLKSNGSSLFDGIAAVQSGAVDLLDGLAQVKKIASNLADGLVK
ncbi:MAG: DUF2341 domain-containing protein, partial [Acholeplasmataceae bacterium]